MSHMTMGDEIHALRTDRASTLAEIEQVKAERDELRRQLDTLIDAACLDGAGHRLRAVIEHLQEQGMLAPEIQQLRETDRLAKRFAKAKGRHHSQHAMCDLLEHLGMPCVRPGEDAEMVACACGDSYPPDSYGAGFIDANGGVCENCAAATGGAE